MTLFLSMLGGGFGVVRSALLNPRVLMALGAIYALYYLWDKAGDMREAGLLARERAAERALITKTNELSEAQAENDRLRAQLLINQQEAQRNALQKLERERELIPLSDACNQCRVPRGRRSNAGRLRTK